MGVIQGIENRPQHSGPAGFFLGGLFDYIELAMQTIRAPIRTGHETFGHDLARCAMAYDLCHPFWTEEERAAFHDYMNRTVDANVNSETHVFHNAWYGYKNWGIGLACYATFYVADALISFTKPHVGGTIEMQGPRRKLGE